MRHVWALTSEVWVPTQLPSQIQTVPPYLRSPLQKTLRIDVDLHPDRAAWRGPGGNEDADELWMSERAFAVDEQAEAVAAGDQGDAAPRPGRAPRLGTGGRGTGAGSRGMGLSASARVFAAAGRPAPPALPKGARCAPLALSDLAIKKGSESTETKPASPGYRCW